MEKQKQIDILAKLISIKSVNDNEGEVADYIESLFTPYQDQGVQIDRIQYAPGRDNLVVTIGSGDRILGFSGHEDVVSAGDEADWQTDPFQATIKDGNLYGRGASDMKSGLAGLIIAEPGNDMTEIGYTSKGVIDYIVTSVGKQAHSSQPEKGINAIDHLIDFATQVKPLMAQFDQVNPILGKLTHVQSVFQGGSQINSVPDKAIIKGNIRTIPEYPNKVVFAALNDLVEKLNQKDGYDLSIRYSFPEEAMPGDKNTPLIKLMEKVHGEIFKDRPVKAIGQSGASDGSEFLHGKGDFAIAEIGPGNNTQHQTDEFVNIETFYKSVEFYKQVAKEFFTK